MVWSATTQLALIAIIVAIATTSAVLLRRRTLMAATRFAAFAISIALYYCTAIITSLLDINQAEPRLAAARVFCGTCILVSATVFFDTILGEAGVIVRARRALIFALATLLCGFAGVLLFDVVDDRWRGHFQLIASVTILGALGLRAALVFRDARKVQSYADRVRLRYLAAGGLIAAFGLALDLIALTGAPTPPLGGLLIGVYPYFISQGLIVDRILDLQELLGRALVFAVLSLILGSVYGLLVMLADDKLGVFVFNTFAASSLILILYEPLNTFLENAATRLLLRERLSFTRSLLRCARSMATVIEPEAGFNMVLDEIYEHQGATSASIYLFDSRSLTLVRQAYRGSSGAETLSAQQNPALFRRALESEESILRDRVQNRRRAEPTLLQDEDRTPDAQLLGDLDQLPADVAIPIRAADITLGLLCLSDDRLEQAYAREEVRALRRVARQLGIIVKNSQLYSVIKEKERLAALGEMSAGLAHEIRNPLAAIKGAAQLLDPETMDGEDGELLDVIVTEVDRLNGVVSEFLDYARPHRGTYRGVDLNEVLRHTVHVMSHDIPEGISLHEALDEDLPPVFGDPMRLQQVLVNLLINARDAMKGRGEIFLSTRRDDNRPQNVHLEVADTGPGLTENSRQNLFVPFFTTKENGTGLGLPVCQRIIENHGGTIRVENNDRGCTFVVSLTSLESAKEQPFKES